MRLLFIVALFGLLSSVANSTPVRWEIMDVRYISDSGSGSVTGYFTYDADTNTYSNYSVTAAETYAGDSCPPTSIGGLQCFGSDSLFKINDPGEFTLLPEGIPFYAGIGYLKLVFEGPLTNAGGRVLLTPANDFPPNATEGSGWISCDPFEGVCGGDETYSAIFVGTPAAGFYGGSVFGTVVPIPAAVWLFGSALAALGVARRRLGAP